MYYYDNNFIFLNIPSSKFSVNDLELFYLKINIFYLFNPYILKNQNFKEKIHPILDVLVINKFIYIIIL